MRTHIRAEIAAIQPLDDLEREHIAEALAWIDSGAELCRLVKPVTPAMHLVSYVVIVDDDHVLLVDHRNARLWLPTGGHVEPGEHPRTTAVREVHEELGLAAELPIEPPLMITSTVTVGLTAGHTDISLWYVLRADRRQPLLFDAAEFVAAQWFALGDVPFERSDPHMRRFVAKLGASDSAKWPRAVIIVSDSADSGFRDSRSPLPEHAVVVDSPGIQALANTMPYPANQIHFKRAGTGPPAILLHGNPATGSLWGPFIERLGDARTLWAIDLPGFGATPAPADRTDYSLANLAATVLRFADLMAIDRFDLVGHSYGGALALTLGTLAPDRIRTLTAITPMTDIAPPMARLAQFPFVRTIGDVLWRMAPGPLRRFISRRMTRVSYGAAFSAARSDVVAREVDRPGLVASAIALVTEADYPAYSRSIDRLAEHTQPPLLLIGAGLDRVVPYDHFERLMQRLTRARRFDFPEGSHMPMWQYPDEVARLVRGFWEDVVLDLRS